ncbi:hypothetical protein AAG570_007470 [Ranatra chinensis]|uniref:NWD1/2-like winged helix-turn-helix domain-containing protein n=1 Tax=Ranatra chinensis TaxID=642074 RepID=A0ABD0XXT3_9HEMI
MKGYGHLSPSSSAATCNVLFPVPQTLAWQTSWCSEFEHSLQPRGNLRDQLSNMLSDLETILGQKLVEMCLSLLTAAKWGLTDSEMVDLLTSNKDFHTSTTYPDRATACSAVGPGSDFSSAPKSEFEKDSSRLQICLDPWTPSSACVQQQYNSPYCAFFTSRWAASTCKFPGLIFYEDKKRETTEMVAWAGACLFWSVLSKQLWPFLRWHGGGGSSLTVTWRDWSLRKTVEDRYKLKTAWAHSTLLAYFTGKLCDDSSEIKARMIDQPNKFSKSYNRRKLEEVPYQCYKVTGTCKSYLEDHEWIFDKLCGSSVYQVLEDLRLEGSPDLDWLQRSLEASAQALDYDGSQFYAQMALRLAQSDATTLPPPAKKLMDLIDNGPPVQSLIHVTHPEHRKGVGGVERRAITRERLEFLWY